MVRIKSHFDYKEHSQNSEELKTPDLNSLLDMRRTIWYRKKLCFTIDTFRVCIFGQIQTVILGEKSMRMILVAVVFLSGCAVNEYYSPQASWSNRTTIGYCGNRFEIFKREVSDGIYLEMIGPYNIIFRMEEGRKVQFKSGGVKITHRDTDEKIEVAIEEINTGIFLQPHNIEYDIPEAHFGVLDEFEGTGNYKEIYMRWGEWSSERGELDIFQVKLSQFEKKPSSQIEVELPPFFAQGQLVVVEPILFNWKKDESLPCVE